MVSGVAAEQALKLDELAYGKWNDRELMHDYLIGWLTHCLTDSKVPPCKTLAVSTDNSCSLAVHRHRKIPRASQTENVNSFRDTRATHSRRSGIRTWPVLRRLNDK